MNQCFIDTKQIEPSKFEMKLPIVALQSEGSIQALSAHDKMQRESLVIQLRQIPREALDNLRHFQAQIGCLNRCSFCSQSAGTTLWNMSRSGLANLIAALKTVCLELALKDGRVLDYPLNSEHVFSDEFKMPQFGLLGTQRNDRPGVIYCYLDNDPSSYPHLDDLIQWFYEDLGVTVRIATVGYSRRNIIIQNMHQRISKHLMNGIAGIRLSFSAYTHGYTNALNTSRHEFELDTAEFLDTYRNTFLSQNKGRKTACIELRFKPLVVSQDVRVLNYDGRIIIRSGSYLVIQQNTDDLEKNASICDPHDHGKKLSANGTPCFIIRAKAEILENTWESLVQSILSDNTLSSSHFVKEIGLLHHLNNEDGEYYAVNAERNSQGVHAKFFYPLTECRPNSGMIDGERYHLNMLLALSKQELDQSWNDFDKLIEMLSKTANRVDLYDTVETQYIRKEIIDLVKSYARVLQYANYPSNVYFDKNLSVDTGHICNLGRAYHEYKAIASRANLPLTPDHERAFGTNGELAEEGIAWRIAITPNSMTTTAANARGVRNQYKDKPMILIEKLDLSMTATSHGQAQEKYFLAGDTSTHFTLQDMKHFPLIPGIKQQNSI